MTIEQFCHNFIDQLETVHWFKNIGQPLSDYNGPFRVKQAENVSELYTGLKSDNWCNIDLTAYNKLCWSIRKHISECAELEGNSIAGICHKQFCRLEKNISTRCQVHGLRSEIKTEILGVLIRTCQEQYFKMRNPAIRSDFATNVLEIYFLGHIPCGWIGELVVELYNPMTFAGDALNNMEDSCPFNYENGELLIY